MRKEIEIKIDQKESRDFGKRFLITEMPATQQDKFVLKVMMALSRSGMSLNKEELESMKEMGIAALAVIGLRCLQGLLYDDASAIYDEMMQTAKIKEPEVVRALTPYDIEEVATMVRIRKEVWNLNIDFFAIAAALT